MTNPNPTPTPAETPQHSQAVASGQLQQPIPTTPPPAPATPAPPQPPTQPPASSPSETDAKPPEPVTDWKTHARTWEQRAKENSDKAAKYDEAEAAKRTQQENDAIALAAKDLEITQLREQALRAEVARTTGVPPSFITGTDEAAMRAAAAEALAWKGTGVTPEPPKTSAVPASTVTSADTMNGASPMGLQQLTREQFVALSDTERMKAVRSGQCTNLGIGVPKQQRRMGNQLELGANVSTQAGPPGAGQSIVP